MQHSLGLSNGFLLFFVFSNNFCCLGFFLCFFNCIFFHFSDKQLLFFFLLFSFLCEYLLLLSFNVCQCDSPGLLIQLFININMNLIEWDQSCICWRLIIFIFLICMDVDSWISSYIRLSLSLYSGVWDSGCGAVSCFHFVLSQMDSLSGR